MSRKVKQVGPRGLKVYDDDPRTYEEIMNDNAQLEKWLEQRQVARSYQRQVRRAEARGEVAEGTEEDELRVTPARTGATRSECSNPNPNNHKETVTVTTATSTTRPAAKAASKKLPVSNAGPKPSKPATAKQKAAKKAAVSKTLAAATPVTTEPVAKELPELPAPQITVGSLMELFFLDKTELLANVQALSMTEPYETDFVRGLTKVGVQDIVRRAIHEADRQLELKAEDATYARTRGDVDAYFGFTELPKGRRAITAANTNLPTTPGV